jgi:flagellar assembly factor FliW
VSPRSFVPDFQLRVARSELMPLALDDVQQAQVLAIVGKNERGITLNLRAPLVINEERRIGRQVITNNDAPIQYELASDSTPMRKVA